MQLAAADVESDHAGRPALEEDVREPAGGRADVERVASLDVDAELVERVRELLAAAGGVLRRPLDDDLLRARRPARPPSSGRAHGRP